MFGMPSRRRWASLLVLLWSIAVAGAIGCSGGSTQGTPSPTHTSIPATTAGSYTFAVTGTDTANSNITTSGNVTITVR
jgi:hypothetical protein